MQPVAFAENTRAEVRLEGGDGTRTGALSTGGGKPGQGIPCVAYGIRTANTSSNGWGIQEEVTHTLDCAQGAAVAHTTHTLRGEGFDASEDGTGRGTPLVPVAYAIGSHAGAADGDQTNRSHSSGGPVGSNISEELAYSLRAGRTQSVASVQPLPFDTTQITSATNRCNPEAGDPCHPLAAGAHAPAIAFSWNAQPDQMRFDAHCSATLTRSRSPRPTLRP
jgi:hypothetical protein